MSHSFNTRKCSWGFLALSSLTGLLSGCQNSEQRESSAVESPAWAILRQAFGAEGNLAVNTRMNEATRLEIKSDLDSMLKLNPKAFGLYQWNKSLSYGDGLISEIDSLGLPPAYALYFVDKSMGFPEEIVRFNSARNIRTIVTQELKDYTKGWDAGVLDSINAGKWDSYFRKFAKAARKANDVVYYRFGYEMNGDWLPWGEQPEGFRLAWRRAWRIFNEEGARNVRWVFSPNVIWEGRTFATDIAPYYPGSRYVDIVGLDGYNFGDKHSRHHRWRSYQEVFGPSLAGMRKHYKDKPLWITEIGCAEGEGKPAWIRDFLTRFNADPEIRAFIWFNEDKQYAGEPNWRLDSEPASFTTFKDWVISNSSITTFALPDGSNTEVSASVEALGSQGI